MRGNKIGGFILLRRRSQLIKQATRIKFGLFVSTLLCVVSSLASAQTPRVSPSLPVQEKTLATRTLYQINFALDFDARTFRATERVRWVNR
ncbi:MAG: hypothetical protein LC747_01535, partial [Acidobacteria bacterium]|nr:hypothetical protein [Acidobacteriota bacterium]